MKKRGLVVQRDLKPEYDVELGAEVLEADSDLVRRTRALATQDGVNVAGALATSSSKKRGADPQRPATSGGRALAPDGGRPLRDHHAADVPGRHSPRRDCSELPARRAASHVSDRDIKPENIVLEASDVAGVLGSDNSQYRPQARRK